MIYGAPERLAYLIFFNSFYYLQSSPIPDNEFYHHSNTFSLDLQWVVSEAPPIQHDEVTMAMLLDTDHAYSTIEVGPPSDSSEVMKHCGGSFFVCTCVQDSMETMIFFNNLHI